MKVYDGSPADGGNKSGSDGESEGASVTADADSTERVNVGIAEYRVASGGTVLSTSGLGSCLGVAVHDPETGTGGLVHAMLPSKDGAEEEADAKFADAGIRRLVKELERRGADRSDLVAKIAGGSDMLDFSETGSGIGARNTETGRRTLDDLGIPVVGEDVGGEHGRSLRLETDTGDLVVRSANRESVVL